MKSRTTRILPLLCTLTLLPSALPAAAPTAEEVFPELTRLIDQALARPSRTELRDAWDASSEAKEQKAQSINRPRANAYGFFGVGHEFRDDGEDRFRGLVDARVEAIQPLYHWGRLENESEIVRGYAKMEALQAEEEEAQMIQYLRRSYIQWVVQGFRLKLAEHNLKYPEQALEADQRLRSESRISEAEADDREIQLMETQVAFQYARRELKRLAMEIEALTGTSPGQPDEPHWKSLMEMPLDAFAQTTDPSLRGDLYGVVIEDLSGSIEDLRADSLDKAQRPLFDLVAGVLQDQIDLGPGEDPILRWSTFIGLRVTWNIWDGGSSRADKLETLARARRATWRMEENRNRYARDLELAVEDIGLSRTAAETRDRRVVREEQRLAYLTAEAEAGRISNQQLRMQEGRFYESRLSAMQDRANLLLNYLQLEKLAH